MSSRCRQRFRPFTLKKLTDTAKLAKSIILYDFLERMTTLPKMCLPASVLSMGMNIEVENPVSTTTIIPALYLYGGSTSKVRLTFTTLSAGAFLWVSLKDVVQPI